MIDELLLISGNDIPFPQAGLTIHQPTLKEIAYITEQHFWNGCQLLKFDKEILPDQDKVGLSNISNFNIIMTVVQEKSIESRQARVKLMSILALLFPTNEILLGKNTIQLRNPQSGQIKEMNNENFQPFKQILIDMFCLSNQEDKQYNPSGQLAKKIANKIKRCRQKKAKLGPDTNAAIFSRYASVLAVGLQKDINSYMHYTVYQIMDEFKRFELKLHYDTWEKFKIAGATGMEDPEDWLKDIHQN